MLDAKLWVARSTRARDVFLLRVAGLFVNVLPLGYCHPRTFLSGIQTRGGCSSVG